MNKRHYEHTLPNIRGSLSNTYIRFLLDCYNFHILVCFLMLHFLQMYLQSKCSKPAFPLLRTCGFDMDASVVWLLESDRKISIQYIFSIQSRRFKLPNFAP